MPVLPRNMTMNNETVLNYSNQDSNMNVYPW